MKGFLIGLAAAGCGLVPQLSAQPGRGPGTPRPPDPKAVQRRIGEIRARLEANQLSTSEQRELAAFVREYLDRAGRELAMGRQFQAARLADAADACRRPIEHLQNAGGPAGPPPPPLPDDRLRQVYFRLRVSEFFLQQIPAPKPKRLLELARAFYELAVKAKEAGAATAASEYATAADDLTHALESLAQAYVAEVSKLP